MSERTKEGAEMEAGRALDALIAERVFGYEWRDVRLRGETNTVPVLLHPSVGDIDGMYDRASLRHPRHAEYSTEIANAWEVHGAMCQRPFSIRRRYFDELQRAVSRRMGGAMIAWPDVLVFIGPVDFCLSALAALAAT